MAELSTAARPYAKALFQLALEEKRLADWSEILAALSALVAADDVRALIAHPALSRAELADLLAKALSTKLDGEGCNLVRLLAENGRLSLLPMICEAFEDLKATAERSAEVEVTTAVAVSADQQAKLADAVQHRLGLAVQTSWKVDPELLAGAVIRSGDMVIDGSVAGELERMRQALAV